MSAESTLGAEAVTPTSPEIAPARSRRFWRGPEPAPTPPDLNGAPAQPAVGPTGLVELPSSPPLSRPPVTTTIEPPARPSTRARRKQRRLRARKVHRIIRHVDPWSVLKIALILYICMTTSVLLASIILWSVAQSTGTIDNVESFIEELFAFKSFQFEPELIFRAGMLVGAVFVVAATVLTTLGAMLFNLISDLTGGIRLTVIEEEAARPAPPRRPRTEADSPSR